MDRQAIIDNLLDHYERPRNQGALDDADVVMPGGIPDCGDTITLYLKVEAGRIAALTFEGQGCTVSQAAASILTDYVRDQPVERVALLDDAEFYVALGREVVQSRPRCASLALNTLKAALLQYRRSAER
ncbi:iron-sulfur cluster assembly scaffold protein [Candidatus Gracilibacteria bacterium]|nr:iron-sulfur cluster assembly scaffold protein [Candidatus Gracilibacteria bacterium]